MANFPLIQPIHANVAGSPSSTAARRGFVFGDYVAPKVSEAQRLNIQSQRIVDEHLRRCLWIRKLLLSECFLIESRAHIAYLSRLVRPRQFPQHRERKES